MSMNRITINFFFKADGSSAAPTVEYEYDPESQQDLEDTAIAVANVLLKIEKIEVQNKVALGVKCNMRPDFQPYLMAAVNKIRKASWNVTETRLPARPVK